MKTQYSTPEIQILTIKTSAVVTASSDEDELKVELPFDSFNK